VIASPLVCSARGKALKPSHSLKFSRDSVPLLLASDSPTLHQHSINPAHYHPAHLRSGLHHLSLASILHFNQPTIKKSAISRFALLPDHTSRDLTRLAAKKDQPIRLSPDQRLESAIQPPSESSSLSRIAHLC
jgi:hypothetical protein